MWFWIREPKALSVSEDKIEIITNPHTDLWQRTYYHFRNDNAPVLQMKTSEKFFSFVVKTEIDASITSMWYRFSRREDDYCIECSEDDIKYKQMRIYYGGSL